MVDLKEHLYQRRAFLKGVIATAGLTLAAPALLSRLSPEGLTARASGVRSTHHEPRSAGPRGTTSTNDEPEPRGPRR